MLTNGIQKQQLKEFFASFVGSCLKGRDNSSSHNVDAVALLFSGFRKCCLIHSKQQFWANGTSGEFMERCVADEHDCVWF